MSVIDRARNTQLINIQSKYGKPLGEWVQLLSATSLEKHMQLVAMLKTDFGISHGDANLLVHLAKDQALQQELLIIIEGSELLANQLISPKEESLDHMDALYVDKKAGLRPIHEKLLVAMQKFGQFEVAPKKSYISYRVKKQFCMVGPANNTQIELGLNIKTLPNDARLKVLPQGQMCNYKIRFSSIDELDNELISYLHLAYKAAC